MRNIIQNSIISFLRLLGKTLSYKITFILQLLMNIFRDFSQMTIHMEAVFTLNQIIYESKKNINNSKNIEPMKYINPSYRENT